MFIWEMIIIIAIGIAAAAGFAIIIVREIRGKGICSSGACSACNLSGQCKSMSQAKSVKAIAGRK
jgi:hypothetical protein